MDRTNAADIIEDKARVHASLLAEITSLKTQLAEAKEATKEAWEAARPVANCGFVGEGDGCCEHPKAMTPECHGGVICPVKDAQLTELRSQLSQSKAETIEKCARIADLYPFFHAAEIAARIRTLSPTGE